MRVSKAIVTGLFAGLASGGLHAQTVPGSCLIFGIGCPIGSPFAPNPPPGGASSAQNRNAPIPYVAAGDLTVDAAAGTGGLGFNAANMPDLLLNEYLASSRVDGIVLAMQGDTAGIADARERDLERIFGIVQADYNSANKELTGSAGGYHYDVGRAAAGIGFRYSPDTVFGFLIHGLRSHATAVSGSTDVDSGGVVLSAAQRLGRDTAFEVYGKYSLAKYDISRNLIYPDGQIVTFTGKPDGNQVEFAASVRQRFSWNAVSVVPALRFEYLHLHVDSFTETGQGIVGADVSSQNVESVRSVVGASVAYAFSTSAGVISPLVTLEWVHEFKNNARVIQVAVQGGACCLNQAYLTDDPVRDYGFLRVGASWSLNRTTDLFADFMTIFNRFDIRNSAVWAVGLQSRF